jgi:formamidopyrimidine-DNA glycosylase
MPEICEIVLTSQYLLSKLKNRYITSIQVLSGRYTHQKLSGLELIKNNKPLKIINIDSKGKFMWFELESETGEKFYVMNTFGLTGMWEFEKGNSSRIKFQVTNNDNDKKYNLYYTDDRNFGTIEITNDIKKLNKKLNMLAPDFLKTNFTLASFNNWIAVYMSKSKKRKTTQIVKLLSAQDVKNGIGSGLGNYLVPEILYRAKISPCREIGSLTKPEITELYKMIKYVLKLCYLSNTIGYMINLGDYIQKHKELVKKNKLPNYHPDVDIKNDNFEFLVYRQKKDKNNNPIVGDEIIKGRTTYWCPNIQK